MRNSDGLMVLFIGVLLIIIRCFCEGADTLTKEVLVAAVNAVSLFLVFKIIMDKVHNRMKEIDDEVNKIKATQVESKWTKRFKLQKKIFLCILMVILFVYVIKFKKDIFNDIITIITLLMSFVDDDISDSICDKLYKE